VDSRLERPEKWERLMSPNGRFALYMRPVGNLGLYDDISRRRRALGGMGPQFAGSKGTYGIWLGARKVS
jgi:hypothetical protein